MKHSLFNDIFSLYNMYIYFVYTHQKPMQGSCQAVRDFGTFKHHSHMWDGGGMANTFNWVYKNSEAEYFRGVPWKVDEWMRERERERFSG